MNQNYVLKLVIIKEEIFYQIDMQTTIIKNWAIGTTPQSLKRIHEDKINIAIYKRDTSAFVNEINHLLEQNITFKSSGDIDTILSAITEIINPKKHGFIIQDIKRLLYTFKEVTDVNNFRLLLATVNTNMCKKFHTDINTLRMLCTYSGAGTLWLTDDNINRKALILNKENIAIQENEVRQVKTGNVAILKGGMYPDTTNAVIHRSPTIEATSEKRLLLRIDMNESLNLWI